ncbi:hypothetical protein OL230_01055 [Capnocytophaga ochracea]|uniref:hypothetical protein n=1 Tax=Capnocytophaga ochracea TaxID=1018 RepID=UPI00222EFC40|nr:hypothetical protein [Capnocytophaga ochracea]UZD38784.1 hypothetical protein OL230_01055 [Capnocytophaga ochracea]
MRKLGASYKLAPEEINFAKGASRTCKNFGKVNTPKNDTFELSKGSGKVRKREGRVFDEKRV